MTAITNQKYDTKIAIYDLMTDYLEAKPQEAYRIATSLMQDLASRMTLRELRVWRDRLNEAVAKYKA